MNIRKLSKTQLHIINKMNSGWSLFCKYTDKREPYTSWLQKGTSIEVINVSTLSSLINRGSVVETEAYKFYRFELTDKEVK